MNMPHIASTTFQTISITCSSQLNNSSHVRRPRIAAVLMYFCTQQLTFKRTTPAPSASPLHITSITCHALSIVKNTCPVASFVRCKSADPSPHTTAVFMKFCAEHSKGHSPSLQHHLCTSPITSITLHTPQDRQVLHVTRPRNIGPFVCSAACAYERRQRDTRAAGTCPTSTGFGQVKEEQEDKGRHSCLFMSGLPFKRIRPRTHLFFAVFSAEKPSVYSFTSTSHM